MPATIMKIISGGQTGVDQAALDAAIDCALPHGGWVPRSRRTATGKPLRQRYVMQETPSDEYSLRTEWNVRDSDATLILTTHEDTVEDMEGTHLTWALANLAGKPVLDINLDEMQHEAALSKILAWLNKIRPRILNVAGPREREQGKIHDRAYLLLVSVFSCVPVCETEATSSHDFEVVKARYEQANTNFRHWDQIRWLTPYWFATLFCGFAAFTANGASITNAANAANHSIIKDSLIFLIVFALLCMWLMGRLIFYHNSEINACRRLVEQSPLTPYQRGVLLSKLPFELKGRHLFKTATLYLIVLIVLILIFSFRWWLKIPS